jgi:hypothetical protein
MNFGGRLLSGSLSLGLRRTVKVHHFFICEFCIFGGARCARPEITRDKLSPNKKGANKKDPQPYHIAVILTNEGSI